MKDRSMLYAKIRSGRSCDFRSGSIVNLVLPEIRDHYGMVSIESVTATVFLVKKVSKQGKYEWYKKARISPADHPQFFSQHFWLAIHEDTTILVLDGFLEPVVMQQKA